MSVLIDSQLVRRVAQLSRLELTEQEINQFSVQLKAIVDYIEKINQLDVSGVEPLAHCLPIQNVFRDDQVAPSLDTAAALSNAPDSQDGYFKVPKILDDAGGA